MLYISHMVSLIVFDHPYLIKTHDSESQGQEEADLCDERVSYLQCEIC